MQVITIRKYCTKIEHMLCCINIFKLWQITNKPTIYLFLYDDRLSYNNILSLLFFV